MSNEKYLHFNRNIGHKKPNSLMNKNVTCPFCDIKNTEDIIDEFNNIKLIKNIFPVFENAYQTVLIEHHNCDYDLSTYTEEHRNDLISFGINKWDEMSNSGEFKSVIFYKNHGVYSGGSLTHPHMQIIGLYDIDCMDEIKAEHFKGIEIHKDTNTELNISTMPIVGVTEFNIICSDKSNLNQLSNYIKIITDYILNHLNIKGKSYNIFFYKYDSKIIVKIVSRTVTSPFIHGYLIPQVNVDLPDLVKDIQTLYFN
jgi:galactose-1-phosphate uridylyltransferase